MKLLGRTSRPLLKIAGLLVGISILLCAITGCQSWPQKKPKLGKRLIPSNDRDWTPELAKMPFANFEDTQIDLRNWQNDIIATGNAHIVGQMFEATAQRVSYTESNNMLTMEGSPRQDVKLRHRKSVGGEQTNLTTSKVMYNLTDESYEV